MSIARDPARTHEKKATATAEVVANLDGEARTTVLIRTTHSTAAAGMNLANGQLNLQTTKADAETDGRMTLTNGQEIAEDPTDSTAQSDRTDGLLIHGRTAKASGN